MQLFDGGFVVFGQFAINQPDQSLQFDSGLQTKIPFIEQTFQAKLYALTSMSLNTIAGSRFFLLSSSSSRSRASSSRIACDGRISCATAFAAAAPFSSPESTSDIFTALFPSESELEWCFFFFLSFFLSFFASFSLIADRLWSNCSDCKRAASISVFRSLKPGLSWRAVICGSNENVVPVPVPSESCSAKAKQTIGSIVFSAWFSVVPHR